MAVWPAGEVTFLFTDLVGSTALWERFPEEMPRAYEIHDAVLRSAAEAGGGIVYKAIGDAFQVAFADPVAALVAARAAQRDLAEAVWPTPGPLRVRMAVHRCPAEPADGDYRTPNLNRLGRLLSAAHGGQVLVSEAAAAALEALPDDVRLLDLGSHRLRDLPGAERVWQLAGGSLEERFPPIETLERHPTNLAPAESSFVGREALVGEARRALLAPGGRLVTLTGPGGTGKTRLATEVAAASLGEFPGGVWAVMLAGERDPGRVLPAVAAELGLREQPGETAAEAVAAYVADRRTLLVLDNLEQLSGVAALVAELLRHAPGLTILATSRTPLRVRAEREVPVPPLPVPEPGDPAAVESDAVRLFAARMADAGQPADLTPQRAALAAAICARVDGLPLGIELAAARTRVLGLADLLARLDRRLPLLVSRAPDLPERQRTMRGAIAWSHELLDEPLRVRFRRLALFSGGFTPQAAAAVTGDAGTDPGDDLDLLDDLERLAEHALIRRDPTAEGRLAMLETIREFAGEHLDAADERDAVAARHAAWAVAFAESAAPALAGPEQAAWLGRVAAEHGNLRAALDTLERGGHVAERLRLAASLWRYWWVRGFLNEGRAALEAAVRAGDADASVPPGLLAAALDAAGVLAESQADIEPATACHERALAIWRAAGDRVGCAQALTNLGIIALHDRADPAAARDRFGEALRLYREVGDEAGVVPVLGNLGDAELAAGDFDAAAALFAQSLAAARRIGDQRSVAVGLVNLGALAFFRGDPAAAAAHYEESLDHWRALDDAPGLALAVGNLGEAVMRLGDAARAAVLLDEALAMAEDLGDRQGVAFARSHLGQLLRHGGDVPGAVEALAEAAGIALEIGDLPRLAECLEGAAGAVADAGDGALAATLLGAADAVRAEGAPRPGVHEAAAARDAARARDLAGGAAFDAARAAGADADREALVDRLLTFAFSAKQARPSVDTD